MGYAALELPKSKHGGIHFCPACYLSVEGNSLIVGNDVYLHNEACCLMKWARMDKFTQVSRIREAARMGVDSAWTDCPGQPGKYWARRLGSKFVVNVAVMLHNGMTAVSCGDRVHPLSAYDGYLFTPRLAVA